MTKKIFFSIVTVASAMLLAGLIVIMGILYHYFDTVQNNQLKTQLSLASQAVETSGTAYFKELKADGCRITWVATDGSVLFDTEGNQHEMENHAQREEIEEAFLTGFGESSRYSSTLTEETLYRAKRLSDGTVLRVSVSRASVPLLVLGLLQPIIIVFTLALILSAVIANRLSKKIVEPLNALDLDKPLENNAYDELSPLLTHIERQHRLIDTQKTALSNRQKEFYAVIKNMNEGLILLNKAGTILSINPSAAAFFGADNHCIGRDFLEIERNLEIVKAIETAQKKGHGELQISRNGREYQLNISHIEADNESFGVALLIFDITDRVFAERNRKEFTANVSHELKTPLHTIMGSAELIENGIVKPEDMPRFIENIRSEAARMVMLIEDIIRLSQLDESSQLPMENVDLYELVECEVESLSPIAAEKHITMTLEGKTTVVKGVRQLIHEVVYNLCDNALKYNVDGGAVKITVGVEQSSASVCVADTGIGIPAEHQQRVFERFYRVDKSHSKETGGTGLGLSIVKHAVQYMGGKIHLDSTPGKGTTITVFFNLP